MPAPRLSPSLVIFCSNIFLLASTQQTCYWPDGSSPKAVHGHWASCQAGDSACCRDGDVCLSNGLCYGAPSGGTYRGGCTRKDWNTKFCNNQFCSVVWSSSWADILRCPIKHPTDPLQWWCGNHQMGTLECEVGPGSHFVNWTMATITTQIPLLPQDAATSTPTSPSSVKTAAPTPTVNTIVISPNHLQPITIGASIGIPLGIAALGFLTYLIWRERRNSRSVNRSEETTKEHPQLPVVMCHNCSGLVTEIDSRIGLPELPVKTDFQRFAR